MKKREEYEKLLEDVGTPPEAKMIVELLLDIRELLQQLASGSRSFSE